MTPNRLSTSLKNSANIKKSQHGTVEAKLFNVKKRQLRLPKSTRIYFMVIT